MTNYDSHATRGNHYLEELTTGQPTGAEVIPDTRGTASHQALSFYELNQRSTDMPSWTWLVGPRGWRPEMGRPYNTAHRPSAECNSPNRTCYCSYHRMPIIGENCTCPRHSEQQEAA